jgi:hypothetical protein
MPTSIIDSTPINQIWTFCKGPAHIVGNYPYRSKQIPIFVIESIFGIAQPAISINS